jgi:hypothetical protein
MASIRISGSNTRGRVKPPGRVRVPSATLAVETGAFLAERLAARALTKVFALDVVAGVALAVVVVDRLLDRVPG